MGSTFSRMLARRPSCAKIPVGSTAKFRRTWKRRIIPEKEEEGSAIGSNGGCSLSQTLHKESYRSPAAIAAALLTLRMSFSKHQNASASSSKSSRKGRARSDMLQEETEGGKCIRPGKTNAG